MSKPIFLSLVSLCLLGSGCVAVLNSWSLPFEHYQQGDFKPLIMVEVDTGTKSVGVPYVFEYFGDRVPFGLKVTYITHNVVPHPTLHVEFATVRFDDGTVIEIGEQLQSQLLLIRQDHKYIETFQDQTKPGLFGKATIANCIPKKLPFTLRIKGRMMSDGAVAERFDAKLRFEPDTEMKVRNRVFSE